MSKEIVNMKITSTNLGLEDHGIMTFSLTLEGDGYFQSYGGYALDNYESGAERRIGTAFGMECIKRIMETVGVEKWEDLRGKGVRAERVDGSIVAIMNLYTSKHRLNVSELFESMKDRL
jgi:hypothetical protein